MGDYNGLIMLAILVALLLCPLLVMLCRYDPDSDRCGHGFVVRDDFRCRRCEGGDCAGERVRQ